LQIGRRLPSRADDRNERFRQVRPLHLRAVLPIMERV
jgi:hypothetical protein